MTIFYKNTNSSEELAFEMNKTLKLAENNIECTKMQESIDCLNKAAEILEHLQNKKASEAITVILEKLAGI
jgi:flagellin-specific chaperone FliS